MAIEGRSGDLPFTTRQLAIDFARAYAKLRRPTRSRSSTRRAFSTTKRRLTSRSRRAKPDNHEGGVKVFRVESTQPYGWIDYQTASPRRTSS